MNKYMFIKAKCGFFYQLLRYYFNEKNLSVHSL